MLAVVTAVDVHGAGLSDRAGVVGYGMQVRCSWSQTVPTWQQWIPSSQHTFYARTANEAVLL